MINVKTIVDALDVRELTYPGRALLYYRKNEANRKYYEQNHELFKKIYNGQGIIIINEKVLYASDNHENFLKAIRSLDPEERAVLYWQYIARQDDLLSDGCICVSDTSRITAANG